MFVRELMRVIEKILPLAVAHTHTHMLMTSGKWKALCNVAVALKVDLNAVPTNLLLSLLLDVALTLSSSVFISMLPMMKRCWPANIQMIQDTADTGYYNFKQSLEDQHSGLKKK